MDNNAFHPDKDIWPFAHKVWVKWMLTFYDPVTFEKIYKVLEFEDELSSIQKILRISGDESRIHFTSRGTEIEFGIFRYLITRILTKGGAMLKTQDDIYHFFGKEYINPMLEREQFLCLHLGRHLRPERHDKMCQMITRSVMLYHSKKHS